MEYKIDLSVIQNNRLGLRPKLLTNIDETVKTVLKEIFEETSWYTSQLKYDEKDDLKIRYNIVKNNLSQQDIRCKHPDCNNHKVYKMTDMIWGNYCSHECAGKDKEIYKKLSQNYKDGTIDIELQKKRHQETCLKKFGQIHGCTEESKQKSRETLKDYDGEIYKKRVETSTEKYGFQHAHQKHITNYDKYYDVDFIKSNFLTDTGTINTFKMCNYFNIVSNACHRKLKELNIDYSFRPKSHVRQEPTILYYIRLTYNNKYYYKIGITCLSINDRYSQKDQKKLNIIILSEEFFETGELAYNKEQQIIRENSQYLIEENLKILTSGGNTEVFNKDVYKNDKDRKGKT